MAVAEQNKLRTLYDAVSQKFNLRSFGEFQNAMRNPQSRKAFFDAVSKEFNLHDFNSFDKVIQSALGQAPPPEAPITQLPPPQTAPQASTGVNIPERVSAGPEGGITNVTKSDRFKQFLTDLPPPLKGIVDAGLVILQPQILIQSGGDLANLALDKTIPFLEKHGFKNSAKFLNKNREIIVNGGPGLEKFFNSLGRGRLLPRKIKAIQVTSEGQVLPSPDDFIQELFTNFPLLATGPMMEAQMARGLVAKTIAGKILKAAHPELDDFELEQVLRKFNADKSRPIEEIVNEVKPKPKTEPPTQTTELRPERALPPAQPPAQPPEPGLAVSAAERGQAAEQARTQGPILSAQPPEQRPQPFGAPTPETVFVASPGGEIKVIGPAILTPEQIKASKIRIRKLLKRKAKGKTVFRVFPSPIGEPGIVQVKGAKARRQVLEAARKMGLPAENARQFRFNAPQIAGPSRFFATHKGIAETREPFIVEPAGRPLIEKTVEGSKVSFPKLDGTMDAYKFGFQIKDNPDQVKRLTNTIELMKEINIERAAKAGASGDIKKLQQLINDQQEIALLTEAYEAIIGRKVTFNRDTGRLVDNGPFAPNSLERLNKAKLEAENVNPQNQKGVRGGEPKNRKATEQATSQPGGGKKTAAPGGILQKPSKAPTESEIQAQGQGQEKKPLTAPFERQTAEKGIGIPPEGRSSIKTPSTPQETAKKAVPEQPPQEKAVAPPKSEEIKASERAKAVEVPVSGISTNVDEFQNRATEFSQESVDRIKADAAAGKFDFNKFEPIKLWERPSDKKLFVLAGHSRVQAFKELAAAGNKDFKTIPSQIIRGVNKEKAREIALESNVLATRETPVERANFYRKLRQGGKSNKDVEAEARKFEGKNANTVIAYSHLNPKGDAFVALQSTPNDPDVTTMAKWVGNIRKQFSQLSDSNENEIFQFLKDNFKSKGRKFDTESIFKTYIGGALKQRGGQTLFGNERLNLNNFVMKSSEQVALEQELKALQKEKNQLEAEANRAQDRFQRIKKLKGKELNDAMFPFNDKVRAVNEEIINIQNKLSNPKKFESAQRDLFADLDNEIQKTRDIGVSDATIEEAKAGNRSAIKRGTEEADQARSGAALKSPKAAKGNEPKLGSKTPVPEPSREQPSPGFREVKPGEILKPGVEVKFDFASGKTFVKIKPPKAQTETPSEPGEASRLDESPPFSTKGGTYADPIFSNHPLDASLQKEIPIKKPISEPDIVNAMRKALDKVPIRFGRIHPSLKAAGVYFPKEEVIRLRMANDTTVAAHELGHAIEKTIFTDVSKLPEKIKSGIRSELTKLGKDLYVDKEPTNGYLSEGLAEFIRLYLSTDVAAKKTPEFFKYFENEFLKVNPELNDNLQHIRDLFTKFRKQGAVGRARAKIVSKPPNVLKGVTPKKITEYLSNKWVEEFKPLEILTKAAEKQLGRELLPEDDPFAIATFRRLTSTAVTRYMITESMLDIAGNKVGPALMDAASIVRKLKPKDTTGFTKNIREEFMLYLFGRRALERLALGKNPGITLADAKFLVDNFTRPEFEKAAQIVYEFMNRVLDYGRQGGLISDETFLKISQGSSDYVPLLRVFDDVTPQMQRRIRALGQGKATYLFKGSNRQIKDIFQSMIETTERIVRLTHERQIINAIMKLRDIANGLGFLIEKVPRNVAPQKVLLKEIRRQLEDSGADLGGVEDFEKELTYFTPMVKPGGKDPIVAWRNPESQKIEWYQLDERLYRSLNGLDIVQIPKALDYLFGVPTRIFRLGTTGLRAPFALWRNWQRDFPSFLMQTVSGQNMFKLTALWIRQNLDIARSVVGGEQNKYFDLFKRLGVDMAQPLGVDTQKTRFLSREIFQGKAVRTISHPIEFLRDFLQIPEAATRTAEARAIAEKLGIDVAQPLTMNEAIRFGIALKRVTTDFSASGAYGKVANRMIPFFNSNIQGPRAFARTFKKHPFRAMMKGITALTIPTLAYWWLNKDKEWYKEMPWRQKFSYWYFEFDDKTVFRIPRPFEWGNIFSVLPEAIIDGAYTKNPEEVKGAMKTVFDTTVPDPLGNPVVNVTIEELQNRSRFWNTQIVPRSEEDIPPAEQVGPYTSRLAEFLGQKLNFSPRRIDHIMQGLGGGLARDIAEMTGRPKENKREREPADIPIVGTGFKRGGTMMTQSRSVEKLFRKFIKLRRMSHSRIQKETKEQRQQRLLLTDAVKAISALSKIRNETESLEKRQIIQKEIIRIAKLALTAKERNGIKNLRKQSQKRLKRFRKRQKR